MPDIMMLFSCLGYCLDKTTLRRMSKIVEALLSMTGRATKGVRNQGGQRNQGGPNQGGQFQHSRTKGVSSNIHTLSAIMNQGGQFQHSYIICYGLGMARPLRLEYASALYHVTSREDRREDSYRDDNDREAWLAVLSQVFERFSWVLHAWCQMTNHYHFLGETIEGNLSRGMRQLTGIYTQRFNRRHGRGWPLVSGPLKAIIIQKKSYLLERARYVVLNPLRAGMVKKLEDLPWSSYPATIGINKRPPLLDTDWLLNQFGPPRSRALSAYRRFIVKGKGVHAVR